MIATNGSDDASAVAPAAMAKLPVYVDTKGRVRVSKEQRRVLLAEFERSGMSAAGFAKRTGLKYSTFATWVQRHRGAKRPGRKSPLRLLEAVVASVPAGGALWVHLPGGARAEVREASQLPLVAALVQALEKLC